MVIVIDLSRGIRIIVKWIQAGIFRVSIVIGNLQKIINYCFFTIQISEWTSDKVCFGLIFCLKWILFSKLVFLRHLYLKALLLNSLFLFLNLLTALVVAHNLLLWRLLIVILVCYETTLVIEVALITVRFKHKFRRCYHSRTLDFLLTVDMSIKLTCLVVSRVDRGVINLLIVDLGLHMIDIDDCYLKIILSNWI